MKREDVMRDGRSARGWSRPHPLRLRSGGGFLGSVVVFVVLIPVLGILKTCLLVASLKLGSLLLVAALSPRS